MNFFFLTSIIILSIFVLLALAVSPRSYWSDSLVAKDYSLFLTVNNSHYGLLNELMIWMTLYGREIVWIIVIIMFFIFGGWLGKKIAVTIGISILVLTFLVPVIKNLVERPRPLVPLVDFLLAADKEYAFPSGHATIVAAGLAVVLALYRGSARRTFISIILSIEAALVCISRVYVGAHYPLDVLGGILLGIGISFVCVGSIKSIESRLMVPIKRKLQR
ncbi:MAG TPA: phosphatase PAP2 family protein [Nitrososphaeraceae archaeon]